MAIVGSTVSVYTAALRHSSSTLTPISVCYLLLLAINYSIMPRISKKYFDKRISKESIALVEEVTKFSMGVAGFAITHPAGTEARKAALRNWTLSSSFLAAGLPSALYAIQGVLTYTSYQNLDSVTFNGLTQTKTLSAALFCYLLLGKVQSPIQILALGLLSLSAVIFQGLLNGLVSSSSTSTTRDLNKESSKDLMKLKMRSSWFVLGVIPCLTATVLSGFAGALSQKSLQSIVGSMNRDAYFYSAEISFFSAVCLTLSIFSKRISGKKEILDDKNAAPILEAKSTRYFQYWSYETFVPILVKATGGILTALLHKHAGSVMKGFALVLGLVFSGVTQTALDDKALTFSQALGTVIVLLSSWLHFTNPAI